MIELHLKMTVASTRRQTMSAHGSKRKNFGGGRGGRGGGGADKRAKGGSGSHGGGGGGSGFQGGAGTVDSGQRGIIVSCQVRADEFSIIQQARARNNKKESSQSFSMSS